MPKLAGKVAVVTGFQGNRGGDRRATGRGRGRGRRQILVQQGGRRQGRRQIVGKGGKAVAVQANVSQPADIERLFAETKARSAGSTSW